MPEHFRCIQCLDLKLHDIEVCLLLMVCLHIRHVYIGGPGFSSISPPNSSSKDTQGDRCPPAEKTASLEGKPRGVKVMRFAEKSSLLLVKLQKFLTVPRRVRHISRTDHLDRPPSTTTTQKPIFLKPESHREAFYHPPFLTSTSQISPPPPTHSSTLQDTPMT